MARRWDFVAFSLQRKYATQALTQFILSFMAAKPEAAAPGGVTRDELSWAAQVNRFMLGSLTGPLKQKTKSASTN